MPTVNGKALVMVLGSHESRGNVTTESLPIGKIEDCASHPDHESSAL